ncbi:MAG: hypothetical protein AAGA75_22650, partial [Cyanobacteria bacterium P01_E01_bin.6]
GEGGEGSEGGEGGEGSEGGEGGEGSEGGEGGEAFGGSGNDTIFGSDRDDLIDGGRDDDSLDGNAGDDTIRGGSGNDTIAGGDGIDSIDGGFGNDLIEIDGQDVRRRVGSAGGEARGGRGNDTISGGNGTDFIVGGAGNDELAGSRGSDTISGGAGNDKIAGFLFQFDASTGPGRRIGAVGSVLEGGRGQDTITGGLASDVIDGGSGNDVIEGSQGQDTITGGSGNDIIAVDAFPDEPVEELVEGLAVFDVSNPDAPDLVSNIAFETSGVSDIAVQDNVFASSNPDTEELAIGTFNDSGEATLSETLDIPGGASEVAFAPNGLAVVVGDIGDERDTQTSSLTLVDVSTGNILGSLDFTGDVDGTFDPFGVAISTDSNFAYVSGGFLANEVAVFNIADPSSPSFVTTVETAGSQAFGISLVGDKLLVSSPDLVTSPEGVTTFDGFVTIVDVSDPANPEVDEVVSLAPLGAPVDTSATGIDADAILAAAVSGDFSAAGGPAGGVSVIEAGGEGGEVAGNLELPLNTGSNVVATEDFAFISTTGGLFIVDVSDPDFPSLVSQTPLDSGTTPTDVAVTDNFAFLTVDEGDSGDGGVGGPVVGFEVNTAEVVEGGQVTFTFDVQGELPAEGLTVAIASETGPAALEFDPSILSETPDGFAGPPVVTADNVQFTLTDANASITLTLADDGIPEGTETVNLFIEDGDLYDVDPTNSSIDLFVSDIDGADGGFVFAGNGNDFVLGSNRNDLLSGDAGRDTIDGGAGDDLIMGVTGNDLLTGGKGSDVFIFGNGDGRDTITDFEVGSDSIGLVEGELVFEDLTITQVGSAAQIRVTNTGEVLARLNGVDASALGSDSFTSVPDVSNPDEGFLL